MRDPAQKVTQLLRQASAGDRGALAELIPLIYSELRRLAGSYLRHERKDHTLQPTALVHEAYLRLFDQKKAQWQNRNQFFAIAAQSMRRILVDHARAHQAKKRGGAAPKVSLDQAIVASGERANELVALDDALTRLGELDARQAQVVELRFFGGLSIEEIGKMLGISPATVKRDWTVARAWLAREMRRRDNEAGEAAEL